MRSKLSPDEKFQAVLTALRGDKSKCQLARELGVSRQTILAWTEKLERQGAILFAHDDVATTLEELRQRESKALEGFAILRTRLRREDKSSGPSDDEEQI